MKVVSLFWNLLKWVNVKKFIEKKVNCNWKYNFTLEFLNNPF